MIGFRGNYCSYDSVRHILSELTERRDGISVEDMENLYLLHG